MKRESPPNGVRVAAGGDFAFMRDSTALVFVAERAGLFRLEYERVWKPGEKPLRPGIVFSEALKDIEDYGAESICCDTHYIASVYEHTEDSGVDVVQFPSSSDGIARAFVRVRVLLGAHRIDLSQASTQLIDELKETMGRPTPGGSLQISHPRRPGSHGDAARAFVAAMYSLEAQGAAGWHDDRPMSTGARRMPRGDRYRHADSSDPNYLKDLPNE